MRLVLALKIDVPVNPTELALNLLKCLEGLPIKFRSLVAFTPDDGLEATVAHLNRAFEEKRNDQAGNEKAS